tara:strand:+ start:286 stop:1053 length:768 start_codon:yes stop_codon:yes gene_type:complete
MDNLDDIEKRLSKIQKPIKSWIKSNHHRNNCQLESDDKDKAYENIKKLEWFLDNNGKIINKNPYTGTWTKCGSDLAHCINRYLFNILVDDTDEVKEKTYMIYKKNIERNNYINGIYNNIFIGSKFKISTVLCVNKEKRKYEMKNIFNVLDLKTICKFTIRKHCVERFGFLKKENGFKTKPKYKQLLRIRHDKISWDTDIESYLESFIIELPTILKDFIRLPELCCSDNNKKIIKIKNRKELKILSLKKNKNYKKK